MTAREKLEAKLHNLVVEEPAEDAHPAELAMRGALQLAGRHIPGALEEYEGELDELLVKGAAYLLSLRGDHATPVTLECAGQRAELSPGT